MTYDIPVSRGETFWFPVPGSREFASQLEGLPGKWLPNYRGFPGDGTGPLRFQLKVMMFRFPGNDFPVSRLPGIRSQELASRFPVPGSREMAFPLEGRSPCERSEQVPVLCFFM